jgi:hypothetical protein
LVEARGFEDLRVHLAVLLQRYPDGFRMTLQTSKTADGYAGVINVG